MSDPNPNPPPIPQPPAYPSPYPPKPPHLVDAHSKKIMAGLFAILLGNFGIHKFVLGYTTAGVIMIAINFTCIGAGVIRVISIIEGIMYLTKSDEEFYELYIRNKKEWF